MGLNASDFLSSSADPYSFKCFPSYFTDRYRRHTKMVFAVHADLDVVHYKDICKPLAGEPTTLITVEFLRCWVKP